MTKQLNRLNDFYFKFLIGNERNKAIALDFINAVLGTEDSYFTDIIYVDKDEDPETEDSKQSRLDIKGVLNDNTVIELEMQALTDDYMSERSLYYWARMYGKLLNTGDKYSKLKPAVSVIILGFNHLKDEDCWHNEYQLLNVKSKNVLTKDLRIVFLELPKLRSDDVDKNNKLELWGAYFGRKLDDSVLKEESSMACVLEAENAFTADEVMQWKYEQREKFLRDQLSTQESIKRRDAKIQEMEKSIAQKEEELAQSREEIAQSKEELAQSKVENAQKDARIKELEKQLEAALAQK